MFFIQFALASALMTVAIAYKEEKLPPQPYAYEYGVADDYSKANFEKTETQDANCLLACCF